MSSAFYPQGMNSYNNRSSQNEYKPWKGSDEYNNPIGITSGNIRPFTNKDYTNDSNPGFGLPRPIKHYRRGISINDLNSRQVKSSTTGSLVSQLIDNPGGYTVKNNPNMNEVCETFSGTTLVSNYYPFINLTEKPQPGQVSCDSLGKPIGDQAQKAVNRARGASTIIKKNYYTTSSEHLYNRCSTYDQNAFNFKSRVDPNTFVANCSMQNDDCKKVVTYKPSNEKFANQGAVSSSTRILNLQKNTIEQASKSYKPKIEVCKKKVNYKIYQ
jgi:hypothetical protein